LAELQRALDKARRDGDAAEVQRNKALKAGEVLQQRLTDAEAQIKKLLSGAEGQEEMEAQVAKLKDQLEKREAHLTRSENIIKKLMAEVEELKRG
jgi:seryl-tRNA synthetase